MLLSASSSFLNLGVRPRAVTTPVRIRNPSGTWGGTSTTTSKDLCPNTRPRPTHTTRQAALATHHFSTIHAARVRKCGLLDWILHDEREADDPGSYHFAARRSCLPLFAAPAPPFVPSDALVRRQAKCSASESKSPVQPLRVIQAQAQLSLASSMSPGRPSHQHVTPEPNLSVVADQYSLIAAEQKAPSASATSTGASACSSGANASGASRVSATSHGGTRVPTPVRPESPLALARRRASPNHVPPARVETHPTGTGHRLSIALPRPGGALLAPEMITVSARRGGRLAVVADAWHLEHDCE